VWNGKAAGCAQLPTTLPTLDELIGRDADPIRSLLSATESGAAHVFTAHAELEGGRLGGVLEALLAGWKAQGYGIVSLAAMRLSFAEKTLPRHEVVFSEVPGRSGQLAVQGRAVK
jgi:undecaprenyl phosphate-alpha-L-ara4FN deformylase